MNCSEATEAIERLLNGELSQGDERRLREHLAQCSRCRARLREAEAVRELVRGALEAATGHLDRAALLRAIQTRLAESRGEGSPPRVPASAVLPPGGAVEQWPHWRPRRLVYAVAAAVLVVGLGIGWLLRGLALRDRQTVESEPSPSLPIVEAVADSNVTVLYLQTEDPHLHVVWFFHDGGKL